MKRYIPSIFIILGISLSIPSCYMASVMQTDVLLPSEMSFPNDIYRVGVVSRMDLEINSSSDISDEKSREAFVRDSALMKNGVLAFLDGLVESPRFEVYLIDPPGSLKGRLSSINSEFRWSLVDKLAEKDSLDMLISLSKANFTDSTAYARDSYGTYKVYILYPHLYWRFYSLREQKVSQFLYQDTIPFPPGSNNGYPLKEESIRYFKEALEISANECSKIFAPYWEVETRIWFPSGNGDFIQAASLVAEDKWEEASEIWRRMAYGKNKKIASRASFNMAVASEMLDKLDLAREWLKRSKELGLGYYADYYLEIINQRQKIQSKLDKQMK